MDKKYNYKFTPLAENDLDDIFSYITFELSSPKAAENLIDKIQSEVIRICSFPLSCQLVEDEFLSKKGYRKLVVKNFNLYYIVKDDTIIVMRVLYGRRLYNDLLE